MTKRQKAILRRNIIVGFLAAVVAAIIILVIFLTVSLISGKIIDNNGATSSEIESESSISSVNSESSETSSQVQSATQSSNQSNEVVSNISVNLDDDFGMLLLVNADNPLPDNYDTEVRANLVEIDAKYRNNNYVTQIHKDVYPYITAMVAAAQKDGVNLKVWSPFRSYAIQKDLFQKQVNRVGGDEAKAATVVARPGTSEHNTGLCADFNMASDAFESTEMYRWMTENAEDYGFVMRYRKDKQPITGVIHESWHWRFVGINHAKQMNKLDMCLEEYVEWLENEKNN